LTGHLEQVS